MAANIFARSFSNFQEHKTKSKTEKLTQNLHPQLLDEYGDELEEFSTGATVLRNRVKSVETLRSQLKKCRQSGLEASLEYHKVAEKMERWNQQLAQLAAEMQQYNSATTAIECNSSPVQSPRNSIIEETIGQQTIKDLHSSVENQRLQLFEKMRTSPGSSSPEDLEMSIFLLSCTMRINERLAEIMKHSSVHYQNDIVEPITGFVKGPIRQVRYESQEYLKTLAQYQEILSQMNQTCQGSSASAENIRNFINRAVKREEHPHTCPTTGATFDTKKYQQSRVYLESTSDDLKSSQEKSKGYFDAIESGLQTAAVPRALLAHIQSLKSFFREGLKTLDEILPDQDFDLVNTFLESAPQQKPSVKSKCVTQHAGDTRNTLGSSKGPPPVPPPRRPAFAPGGGQRAPPRAVPPSPPKTPAPDQRPDNNAQPTAPSPATDSHRISLLNAVLPQLENRDQCLLVLLNDVEMKLLKALLCSPSTDLNQFVIPSNWTVNQLKFVNTLIQSHMRLFSEEKTAEWMANQLLKNHGSVLLELPRQPPLLLTTNSSLPPPPLPPSRFSESKPDFKLEHVVIKQFLVHEGRHYLKKVIQSFAEDCFTEPANLLSMDIESWSNALRRGFMILFGNRGLLSKSIRQCACDIYEASVIWKDDQDSEGPNINTMQSAIFLFNQFILPALSNLDQWGLVFEGVTYEAREKAASRLGTHSQGALPAQLHPLTCISFEKCACTNSSDINNLLGIFTQVFRQLLTKWANIDWYQNTKRSPAISMLQMSDINATIVVEQVYDDFKLALEQFLHFLAMPPVTTPVKSEQDTGLDAMVRRDVIELLDEDYWGRSERILARWASQQTTEVLQKDATVTLQVAAIHELMRHRPIH